MTETATSSAHAIPADTYDEVETWRSRAAGLVAGFVELSAFFSLVLLLVPGLEETNWASVASEMFDYLLPVGGNLAIVVALFLLGAALMRRKRAAYLTLVALQTAYLVLETGLAAGLALFSPTLVSDDPTAIAEGALSSADFTEVMWELGIGALVTLLVLVVLVPLRPAFPARLAPGAFRRAVIVLVTGLLGACGIAIGLIELFPGTLTSQPARAIWAANQVTGEMFPLPQLDGQQGPQALDVVFGLMGGAVALYAVVVFFRSARQRRLLSADEELAARRLLAEFGDNDSLGYFATRRDKSILFDTSGRAAVSYRVLHGTSLASGDPLGDPDYWPDAIARWRAEAAVYGWTPAVLGASAAAAKAYVDAGLRAFELGDEAVLDVREFSLTGPERKAVRQAVNRVSKLGYTARVRRHRDIPEDDMHQIIRLSEAWRGSDTERGFSMALGRLGDPSDERCVLVEAIDSKGTLRGLLSFSPWGASGLSLDLMRRDGAADNGINEFMVTELVRACGSLGVVRISLNFAMFRAVFEHGTRIGAGPVLRMWRALLGVSSRFFQLESLYRSNAKYGPSWEPRYLCYERARRVLKVGVAAGIAEGFLPSPSAPWAGGDGLGAAHDTTRGPSFVDIVHKIEQEPVQPARRGVRVPEQVRVRQDKVRWLQDEGIDAYPPDFDRNEQISAIRCRYPDLEADTRTGVTTSTAGRVVALRQLGRLCFAVISDFTGEIQVMLSAGDIGESEFRRWKKAIDLGDHIGVTGEIITSRRGELSVLAKSVAMTAKCLHPLPDKYKGLSDPQARVRDRYVDLMVNADSRDMLKLRSRAVRAVRDFLHEQSFLEVETPMLQTVHGGANARPFMTHINAYDMRMYMRIAPELYLKRLCVSGVDRIFELNRNFRNEGVDATHNPEFTMLEAYQSYADYRTMLDTTRRLIQYVATETYGAAVARRHGPDGEIAEYDISGEWPIIAVYDAVSEALGEKVTPDTPAESLRQLCEQAGVTAGADASHGELVLEAYEDLVEATTTTPTFYIDFPVEVSPLTRRHRREPRLAERWDLVAFGAEIGTAYSELTDPIEQRARLEDQSLRAASGDVEAMELDEDFLRALEHGMPPTGGLGMGVDRLLMMLTGASIRQTVLFPFVRPE